MVTICTAQFNIQQFYVLPTQCIYVFCVDLRTNSDYTSQDFGTWKVYCFSNVTFHAEFKYAIKIFPSPTVFVQWHFLLLIFRNFRYFCQWYYYTWTNILNSFQQRVVTCVQFTIIKSLAVCAQKQEVTEKKRFVMALDRVTLHKYASTAHTFTVYAPSEV